MIPGFEDITQPLTEEEKELAEKILRRLEKHHRSKDMAVTAKRIVESYKAVGKMHDIKAYKMVSGRRIRKIVNYLRRAGIPICSTSRGYWYSTSIREIKEQLDGLKHRRGAIQAAEDGLMKYIRNHNSGTQAELI